MTLASHIIEHQALGIDNYPKKRNVEAAELIPPMSIVRYDVANKLRVARTNVVANVQRIAGISIQGAALGFQCGFYGPGAQLAIPGAAFTVGSNYFLQSDGSLGTTPVSTGAAASVLVGKAITPTVIALVLTVYLI